MKDFSVKKAFWLLLFILVVSVSIVYADDIRVTVKLVNKETLTVPQQLVQRVLIANKAQGATGYLVKADQQLLLSLPALPQVKLPYLLQTMISLDGNTILQFGDQTRLTHALRTDLFWLNREGKIQNKLENYFAGSALIAMSDDGCTAVAGNLVEKKDSIMISLFSPTGKEIWKQEVEKRNRIAGMIVMNYGQRVVSILTDNDNWLKNHQLQIRVKDGTPRLSLSKIGIIQKIVSLNDKEIFFQGYDTYGIIDISTGRIAWQRTGKIRMISPYGAALSPDGNTLFLLLADLQKQTSETYRWKFVALIAQNGDECMQEYLPEKYPSTWDRIFEKVADNEIHILAGNQRLKYSWEKKGVQ